MPMPTDSDVLDFIKQHGKFRVACWDCFRNDFDGAKSLPKDWSGIERRQSLRESMAVYEHGDPDMPKGYSCMEWWTHIGLCPDCSKEAP